MKKAIPVFLLLFLFNYSFLQAQCECTNCPTGDYVMGDVVMTIASPITVATNGSDDLADNPLVSVDIEMFHDWLGDVSMSLLSPSGLHYSLMGDEGNAVGECGSPANGAFFTLVPGTEMPLTPGLPYADVCNGTQYCIEGDWNLACGPGAENIHNGAVPAPNCDLNDFNVAGHSVSGTWILFVNCVCNIEFGSQLNNWGLNFQNEEEIECEDTVDPTEPIVIETTIFVGESGEACLPIELGEVVNLCPEEDQNVEWSYEPPCIVYEGVSVGTDVLCILVDDGNGNIVEATIIVHVLPNPQPFVYPGDTNNDGTVNVMDLLYLGLAQGATGPVRADADLDWEAQFADTWELEYQVSNVNYKAADTNGDGLVGAADVAAITQNFGQTRVEDITEFTPYLFENELLSFSADPVEAAQGEFVNIPIRIETINSFQMTGIALDIELNPEVFDISTAEFFAYGEMFGDDSENFLSLAVAEGNIMHVAVSHRNTFGSAAVGTVGSLQVQVRPDAPVAPESALILHPVGMMHVAELVFPLGEASEIAATVISSTNNALFKNIKVYPQPASDELLIEAGEYDLDEVILHNAAGQIMERITPSANLVRINTEAYQDGVYLLSVKGAEGIATRKVVLLK